MKYVIVHQGACDGMHYRIGADGAIERLLDDGAPGRHARCLGVGLVGDFEELEPEAAQLQALQRLLLRIKMTYPGIAVGGHRQIRGEQTTCPGTAFPLSRLRAWSAGALVVERDQAFHDAVAAQYSPRG